MKQKNDKKPCSEKNPEQLLQLLLQEISQRK